MTKYENQTWRVHDAILIQLSEESMMLFYGCQRNLRVAEQLTYTPLFYLQRSFSRDDTTSALNISGKAKVICILLGWLLEAVVYIETGMLFCGILAVSLLYTYGANSFLNDLIGVLFTNLEVSHPDETSAYSSLMSKQEFLVA